MILSLAALLPMTMYSLRNFLGIDRDNFERYVVCPKCTNLYRPEDCLQRVVNQVLPVVCDNILFPAFPRSRRRKACGSKLVKKVILKCGTHKYYPLKVYCYKSVIDVMLLNFGAIDKLVSSYMETFTMVQFGSLFTCGIIANFSPYLEALA